MPVDDIGACMVIAPRATTNRCTARCVPYHLANRLYEDTTIVNVAAAEPAKLSFRDEL